MNDFEPFDRYDPHLAERMERAVGGLRAPEVIPRAVAHGRRLRTRRRLTYAAGGVAAATAIALTVPAFAGDWPGPGQDPSSPSVAADPAATSPTVTGSTTAAPGTGGSEDDPCGASATGWWSKSTAQIKTQLSALLPAGTRIGETDDNWASTWGGNLITGDDADFASLTLLPPPGTPGGRMTVDELAGGKFCAGGSNEPMQAVQSCDQLTGHLACEEIRSEHGTIIGVVTETAEQTIVNGQGQPTDKTQLLATIVGPEGGHVELYVAEGTRADRPHTVHDPADVPALTMDQVREIVADPVWTS